MKKEKDGNQRPVSFTGRILEQIIKQIKPLDDKINNNQHLKNK